MASHAGNPVFVFLPVGDSPRDPDGLVVDPVCGRSLATARVAGRLMHGGNHHYFCSLRCAERFAAAPGEFDCR